jgi:hypothetical protein
MDEKQKSSCEQEKLANERKRHGFALSVTNPHTGSGAYKTILTSKRQRRIFSDVMNVRQNFFNYDFLVYKDIASWMPEWAVDVRHAKILHNLLMHGNFRQYGEIGCCAGASATAAIEALKHTKQLKVHLCDIKFTPPLLHLVAPWLDSGRLVLHRKRSTRFLRQRHRLDFVFLDGSHSLRTVKKELDLLLRQDVAYIAAHDTSALERALAHGMPAQQFSGPSYIREVLQYKPGWFCLEERKRRENEATVRGFFFATKDKSFFEAARSIFAYWADVPYTEEYNCRFDPNFNQRPRKRH